MAHGLKRPLSGVGEDDALKVKRRQGEPIKLRVSTDCSGIECPIVSLTNLGVQVQHLSSCEKSPQLRAFISANFFPAVLQNDMNTRSLDDIDPDVDLYAVGPSP